MPQKSRRRKHAPWWTRTFSWLGSRDSEANTVAGAIPSADLMRRWASKEHFVWLYSEDILIEYKEVLKRLHVRSATIGDLINPLRERAESIEVRFSTEISPDPKDDPFCVCAEQGNADFIFTLNPKDFPQVRLKAKVLRP